MQLSGSHQAVIRQSSGSYKFVRQSKKSPAQAWKVQWQSSGSCQAVRKKLFFIQNSKQTLPEWTKAKTPMRTSEIRRSIFLGENSGKLKENSGKLWTNSGIFFSSNHCEEYGVLEVQSLDPKRSCASMHRSQNKFWLGLTKMFGCLFYFSVYFFLPKSTTSK